MQAAEVAARTAAGDELRVKAFLQERGERGATDEEIETALRLIGSTERPRRIALMNKGEVWDSGRERPSSRGCAMRVWVARPDA